MTLHIELKVEKQQIWISVCVCVCGLSCKIIYVCISVDTSGKYIYKNFISHKMQYTKLYQRYIRPRRK